MGIGVAATNTYLLRYLFDKSVKVSRKVHRDMISRIVRAPCNLFFDRVPIGRLLNRFSGDLAAVDESFAHMYECVAYCLIGFVVSVAIYLYFGTIWLLPLCFGFYKICKRT